MTDYRHRLPQLGGCFFLTDGGIETTLIFHQGIDLPLFASYVLLDDTAGREALKRYYRDYLKIAEERGVGFILESPTWRCSRDWGAKLGHDGRGIESFNREAIKLMEELRRGARTGAPIVISGNIGPRGDGYAPEARLSPDEAEEYHSQQIRTFADTAADMVAAVTMTHTGEAVGVVRAARSAGMPVAIAFTTETDGRLPSGEALGEAIEKVDEATDAAPVYYVVNCAHPDHFADALGAGAWRSRIRGVRAKDTDGAELTLFGGSFVRGRILQGKIPSPLHWPRGRLVAGAAQGCAKAKLGGLRKCFVAGSSEPSTRKAFEHSCDLAGETACHREPTGFPFQPRANFA